MGDHDRTGHNHKCELNNEHGSDHDHSHDHAHDHEHDHTHRAFGHSHLSHANTAQKLALSLGLTCIILAAEVIGGLLSHSLALLSDAGHMVTDIAALGLAWYAQVQASRPPTHRHTYGYHRAGIMAALSNAVLLLLMSAFIVYEAIHRIQGPQERIDARIMFGVAAIALLVNLLIARLLRHSHTGDDLNVRSALLHVIGDAAASAGVLIGGILIAFRPRWSIVDPVLSMIIAVVIVWGAWQVLMEALNVLMEGAPSGLDARQIEASLLAIEGVRQVHHIHVWTLSPGMHAFSGHIVIEDQALSQAEGLLARVRALLRSQYHVDHATIQLEHRECGMVCALSREPDRSPALHK